MVSLGKCFYEFSFSSLDDLRSVQSIGIWNLKPGSLRMFSWTKDFNAEFQHNYNAQCWVRIVGLSHLDDVTSKRLFGYFACVLVDVDLKGDLHDQVLVEREGFAFFV